MFDSMKPVACIVAEIGKFLNVMHEAINNNYYLKNQKNNTQVFMLANYTAYCF